MNPRCSVLVYAYPLAANWLIRVWMCIWLAVIRLSRGSGGIKQTPVPRVYSQAALSQVGRRSSGGAFEGPEKVFPVVCVGVCVVGVCVCVYAHTKTIHYAPICFFSTCDGALSSKEGGGRVPEQTVNSTQPSGIALRQMSCNDWETQGSSSAHTVSLSRSHTRTLLNL